MYLISDKKYVYTIYDNRARRRCPILQSLRPNIYFKKTCFCLRKTKQNTKTRYSVSTKISFTKSSKCFFSIFRSCSTIYLWKLRYSNSYETLFVSLLFWLSAIVDEAICITCRNEKNMMTKKKESIEITNKTFSFNKRHNGRETFRTTCPGHPTRDRVSGNDFLQLKNLPGVRNALCPGVRNWEKTGRSDWFFIIMCDVMTGDRNEKDRVSVTKSTWSSEWMFITMYDVMSGDWNGCGCGFGSYRTPTKLPEIFITDSNQISNKSAAVHYDLPYHSHYEHHVCFKLSSLRTPGLFFYRSGDRNEHLLRESVIKKPCEMSLSRHNYKNHFALKLSCVFLRIFHDTYSYEMYFIDLIFID